MARRFSSETPSDGPLDSAGSLEPELGNKHNLEWTARKGGRPAMLLGARLGAGAEAMHASVCNAQHLRVVSRVALRPTGARFGV